MKHIVKVEINHFRSFQKTTITNLSDLNILSGKNDSGKSNVIRAVELFFNSKPCSFKDEYNKDRSSAAKKIKTKHVITIAITFSAPPGYRLLPKNFRVLRTWDKSGEMINQRDNLESAYKRYGMNTKKIQKAKASLSMYLNKLRFIYIPAVRDEHFFSELLLMLQEEIFAAQDRKSSKAEGGIRSAAQSFNFEIEDLTKDLNSQFKKIAGIDTRPSLPTALVELFGALQIDTKQGSYDIPLNMRGHGIRMRYIPTILNHISTISRKSYIWGFDEPENSCEYSLCAEMANDFQNEYSKNAQVFVITHSFGFISLKGPNISRYRVIKKKNANDSDVLFVGESSHVLEEDLGIIQMNENLKNVYREFKNNLMRFESMNTELEHLKRPLLSFEGPTDNLHFRLAYRALMRKDIDKVYRLDEHDSGQKKGEAGGGARNLQQFLTQFSSKFDKKKKMIAIFDFDKEGFDQFASIKKSAERLQFEDVSSKFNNHPVLKKKNRDIFVSLLIPPEFRKNFVDADESCYCHLETELLYEDAHIESIHRQHPSKKDKTVFSFKGDKTRFAAFMENKSKNENRNLFAGFKKTIELIEKLSS
jgi:AAA15 family ATPase/GTPase